MKALFSLCILILVFGLSACFSKALEPDVSNPIRTIAILPFINQSNNISAPVKIRAVLREKIQLRHYRVLPIAKVDQILADKLGVTLGNHLQDVPFDNLRKELKVDAVIYGEITDFDQLISGAVNANRVSANLKMVDSRNKNNVIWLSDVGIKNQYSTNSLGTRLISESDKQDKKSTIRWVDISEMNNKNVGGNNSNILKGIAAGLFSRNAAFMLDKTLVRETEAFINHSVDNMPAGPGE